MYTHTSLYSQSLNLSVFKITLSALKLSINYFHLILFNWLLLKGILFFDSEALKVILIYF